MLAAQLHLLQPRELAKAGVEDRLGLDVGQLEDFDQPRLGLFLIADDADHLVEIEEGDQHPVEDVQALFDLGPGDGGRGGPATRADGRGKACSRPFSPCTPGAPEASSTFMLTGKRDSSRSEALNKALPPRFGLDVAGLALQHDAHVLGGLNAHVAQELRLLGLDQLGQLLDQLGLFHVVGDLGDDDAIARPRARATFRAQAARNCARRRPVS